ncbi:hypothetical protein GCK32_008931 [Trichostrongylus colubriformis]|uniref:Uncharacterized protein n=1 Tax=Trichostrongylus colubriformis TaxID=6319 RepID=A0AAN8IUG3_TRICO
MLLSSFPLQHRSSNEERKSFRAALTSLRDDDLRFLSSEEEEDEEEAEHITRFLNKKTISNKGEYCAVYRLNYDYFCHGIWSPKKLTSHRHHFERIKEFCPTYKHHCIYPMKVKGKRKHKKHRHRSRLEKEVRRMSYDEILYKLSKIVPCTPECNVHVYPHCTKACKCDYDYPIMRRLCNPPVVENYSYACRAWYNQCLERNENIAIPPSFVEGDWRQGCWKSGSTMDASHSLCNV